MKRVYINDLLNSPELLKMFCSDMKKGSICAIPTDTIYGFAVDAASEKAVKRVYEIKGRNEKKPLILFLAEIDQLSKLQIKIPGSFSEILDSKWPGALTAILKKQHNIEQISAFHYSTIGVRIPDHQNLLRILSLYDGYFLTTSANRSEHQPLTSADEIEKEFYSDIDWLIEDDASITGGPPSTIVDLSGVSFKLLRKGKLEIDENLTDKQC